MVRAAADARGPRGVALLLAALASLAGLGGQAARAEPPPSDPGTRICVHVFDDRNGDGVQQLPDEVGLPGWSVRVQGGRPASLATGEDGVACTSVSPGSTSVQVPSAPAWAPTSRVALRTLVAAVGTTDVYVGFRREDRTAPLKADGATPVATPPPPPPPPTPPPGRQGRLAIGAAAPAECRLTSLRLETTGGRADLVIDAAVPVGAASLPSADVVEARFWYEGAGGVPSVALVTSAGDVVRMDGTIRVLHVRAEVPGGSVYEYDWEAGREWGCPAPSSVRFAPPPPPGRAGEVGRVGLHALAGTVTRLRVATKGGRFDFAVPGSVPASSEDPVRTEDVTEVHFFGEGEGGTASLRLMVKTASGRVHRVPSLPEEPILSVSVRVDVPGGSPYEFAWEDGRSRSGPIPLVVRFTPAR